MKKGVLVELALQSVAGGVKSQDSGRYARKEDIDVYLSAAVNYALTKAYYINKQEHESAFPNDFIGTYILDVLHDNVEDVDYAPLPGKLLSMPGNRGIRYVGAVQGFNQFVPKKLEAAAHDQYYKGSLKSLTSYTLIGQRLVLENLSSMVDRIKVMLVLGVEDIDDEEELPIPAGMEVEVINLLVEFFTGVRSLPKDNKPNNAEG